MNKVTGRRGAVVDQAILAAALEELAEKGYTNFSAADVAARVGVHKTTLYRRWPDREALLTDAVLSIAVAEFSIPDTGDIDTDLRTAIRTRVEWLTGPYGRPLIAMLGTELGRQPAVKEAVARILAARRDMVAERLHAAVAAGQLPAGTNPLRLVTTLVAPIYLSLLVTGEPITTEDADRAAAITLVAARAGLLNG